MYEKRVSWLVINKITGKAICREESLQEALSTVDAVDGLEIKLEVEIRIRKPINEMGKGVDILA
jgi:hypothetical protein